MAKPDPLSQGLVESSFELHRRRLWLEVPGDAPFLIRVPGVEDTLVATITGHEGTEYGLLILRGAAAFDVAVRSITQVDEAPDLESQSVLSFSMSRLEEIEPDLRGILQAAGFQARREALAPLFVAKPPHRKPRAPNRTETRLFRSCIRAILAAADRGEFHPCSLDARRRRVFEITLVEEGRKPSVQTRTIGWPTATTPAEPQAPMDLGPIDPTLPRLDERWVVTELYLPINESGDDRNTCIHLVFRSIEEPEVLTTVVAPSGELEPLADALRRLLGNQASNSSRGLPQRIDFTREDHFHAFARDLALAGIEAGYAPDPPGLAAALSELGDRLGLLVEPDQKGASSSEAMPETLEQWKAADKELTGRLLEESSTRRVGGDRALKRYFGSKELAQKALDEYDRLGSSAAYLEWLFADYRPTSSSKTYFERRLRSSATTRVERALIEARMAARLSIYRVDSAVAGSHLEVEDILTGQRETIQDRSLSGCDVEGRFLPLRLSRLGSWTFCNLAGPPFPSMYLTHALAHLERLGAELTPEGLRRSAHLLGRLWELVIRFERNPPRLTNTDGDPLLMHTATFVMERPKDVVVALRDRPDLDFDRTDGTWTWLRPGGPGIGNRTVLGYLEMLDDRLVLEVNSAQRLERARRWIERIPGVRFERATTHELDSEQLPEDDRLPSPTEPLDPQAIEQIKKLHLEACRRWLDKIVPALGNRTPREACATVEGRRRVTAMVRSMPPTLIPGGSIPAPREALLRELGLGAEDAPLG